MVGPGYCYRGSGAPPAAVAPRDPFEVLLMRQAVAAVLCALGAILACPGMAVAWIGVRIAPASPRVFSYAEQEAIAAAKVDAAVAGLPVPSAGRVLNSAYYRAVTLPTAAEQERVVAEAMRRSGAIVAEATEAKH